MMEDEVGTGKQPGSSHEGYREAPHEAIAGLSERIAQEISASGPMRFDRFMERALYDPQAGYYAQQGRQVGRQGDFYTSVSVGPLFGRILASHLAGWAGQVGERCRILELGAHDGSLAADILAELEGNQPEVFQQLEYVIAEPLPELAARQREKLAPFGDAVRLVASVAELDPAPTFVVGNELIDALTFRVVESTGDGWIELGVQGSAPFEWTSLGDASSITSELPMRPAGYRTEVRTDLANFLKPLRDIMAGGRMMWIDYGFEADDYYADGRSEGTLRTYENHRAADDPLKQPGSRDITAHVEFTSLGQAMEKLGGEVIRFETQAKFLTECARPLLLSLDGRMDEEVASVVRQFQSLTHPGQLGSRFHVMEAVFPA